MPIEFQSSAGVPQEQPLIYRFKMRDDELTKLQNEIGATFDSLPLDQYDLSGRRQRTYAKMRILFGEHYPSGINVQRVKPAGAFSQLGQPDRQFGEMQDVVIDNPIVLNLIERLAHMVKSVRSDAQGLLMDVHQMRYVARKAAPYVLPDGRHTDGADFILSALVIKREGVKGGQSIVYGAGDETLLRLTLDEGEGIFQDDRHLTHEIKPIVAEHDEGIRDMLGFDFKVQTDSISD